MQNGTFTLQSQSTPIGYSIVGSGAPLLICPVSWGVDGHRWTTLDVLAKHFTLIRLDPRGTGTSGEVHNKSEYGIPTLVKDIEALREHLGIERWNVMGQSAGGWTALEYALAHQPVVSKLIIVCSAPTGQFTKGTFRDPEHPLYPVFEKISKEVRSLPAPERVKAFNRAIYQFDVQSNKARSIIDQIFRDADFNAQRNQYFIMNELNRYNVIDQLQNILTPTLIIEGALDVHVSPSWSEQMASNIPNAQRVIMNKSGHFPWLDEPDIFFGVVTNFLV